jgi:hypothetical protein
MKTGTRFKERMRGEERLKGEMRSLEERLSRAKGWPPILFSKRMRIYIHFFLSVILAKVQMPTK